MARISIASPDIGGREKEAVMRVLDSGIIAQGSEVSTFEEEFAEHCGANYAVMLNSGTAAIHAAMATSGIGKGDEVIVPPFTFIASASPILMQGAKPVFADIGPDTFTVDPEEVAKKLTDKTKGLVAVDLYGNLCDYDRLHEVIGDRDITVIEDACQAIGAKYDKRMAGTLANIGAFSLYATKNITSGEGGVVTTDDEGARDFIRSFRQHGMGQQYDYERLGYNYRSTDILAAIARVQLSRLGEFTERRQENAGVYMSELRDAPGIVLPHVEPNIEHVFNQFTIRVDGDSPIDRDQLANALRASDVCPGVYYPKGLNEYGVMADYTDESDEFPNTAEASREVLSLPVHPGVTVDQIRYISSIVLESMAE